MINSEYPTVLKLSACRALLKEAHGTQISTRNAINTVYSYLDEDDMLDGVRFTGKGFCEYRRVGRSRVVNCSGLHEVAHALGYIDRGITDHGPGFVDILDRLIISEFNFDSLEPISLAA